jgi:hypothetical protein
MHEKLSDMWRKHRSVGQKVSAVEMMCQTRVLRHLFPSPSAVGRQGKSSLSLVNKIQALGCQWYGRKGLSPIPSVLLPAQNPPPGSTRPCFQHRALSAL